MLEPLHFTLNTHKHTGPTNPTKQTLTQVLDAQLALVVLHAVEADIGAPTVTMHNGKAVALGLPRE
jgi:hypothetical protein